MSKNSFGSQATLQVGADSYTMYRLDAVYKKHPGAAKLPFSLKILLENLLRTEDGVSVDVEDIEAIAKWDATAEPSQEIAFTPSRVLLQDFTGVPCVVDLAAMRDAMKRMGGDPRKINPLQPVELVIDHSVQVDEYGSKTAMQKNADLEFERNQERYRFLKWGQEAFRNFKAVPPDTGIVHQVNLEFLARVVMTAPAQLGSIPLAYPDTLVGTDSHTTMINGVGVLGWGVGGIEAEAAMLGQPVSMLLPHVIGVRLSGKLPEGTTATDLVLTVTQLLRKRGVVGKFVEFFGPGLAQLPLADRATIANMAPEYGATCGIFPIDAETIRYLRFTGRSEAQLNLVESYAKEQGLWVDESSVDAIYTDTVTLDLGSVEPSLAGPARPQDRVNVPGVKTSYNAANDAYQARTKAPKKKHLPSANEPAVMPSTPDEEAAAKQVDNGSIVIAAITSCTNTSNPSVLMAAGILAKKAVEKGLTSKPWVKTSLGPGSKVVTEYLEAAGLLTYLERLNFYVVGYGCTTCIGNSGPLPPAISKAIDDKVRANYLASPPLVVAYALAGTANIDLTSEPLGNDKDGKPVFLKDIWPTQKEVSDAIDKSVTPPMFKSVYADVYAGDAQWQSLKVPEGDLYAWENDSTYVKNPPYFDGMTPQPGAVDPVHGARVLALLGDSITTDHISPAGSIKADGPAGKYLQEHGVKKDDFNSYGSRRGNHEVMVRGTFANVRLRNQLAPGTEGGWTKHVPSGEVMSIFDASVKYIADKVPLFVIAGKEYGSGSSRDWAAKGPKLLGVRAVLAESYERIHRSNLVGMGILPLQFKAGDSAAALKLTGEEVYDVDGLPELLDTGFKGGRDVTVKAKSADGTTIQFRATVRIDTPQEVLYYKHGGILPYVLRSLLAQR
jgi:aconitate hydratase